MVILRPIEKVFAFVADLDNWAHRRPVTQEGTPTYHAPVRVGDTFRQVFELRGQRVELLGKVVGYEEDALLLFEYAWNGSTVGLGFFFEPVDGGTRLTGKGEGHAGGLLKLFEPLVEQEVNREVEDNLDHLKGLLETGTPNDARSS